MRSFKLRKKDALEGYPGVCGACAFALRLDSLGFEGELDKDNHIMVAGSSKTLGVVVADSEEKYLIEPGELAIQCIMDFDRIRIAPPLQLTKEEYKNEKEDRLNFYERWKGQKWKVVKNEGY